jgi:hypothetical protein
MTSESQTRSYFLSPCPDVNIFLSVVQKGSGASNTLAPFCLSQGFHEAGATSMYN